MSSTRTLTRYCPDLERDITCKVVGTVEGGRKLWKIVDEHDEDACQEFIGWRGDFCVWTEEGWSRFWE